MFEKAVRIILVSFTVSLVLFLGAATALTIHNNPAPSDIKIILWTSLGVSLKLVLWTLSLTGFTDPGYIPTREEMELRSSSELNFAYADMYGMSEIRPDLAFYIHLHPPRTTVYECYTCHSFKPSLSTAHCGDCNRCVVGKDHHCAFLGTCIGIRNRSNFLAFLFSCTLACIFSFVLLIIDLVRVVREDNFPRVGSMFTPLELGLLAAFGLLVVFRICIFPFVLSYAANLEILGFIFLFGFAPLIEMNRQDHIPWFSSVPAYLDLMVLFFLGSNLYYQIKLLREGSTIREMMNGQPEDDTNLLLDSSKSQTVIKPLSVSEVVQFTVRGFWISPYPKYLR